MRVVCRNIFRIEELMRLLLVILTHHQEYQGSALSNMLEED